MSLALYFFGYSDKLGILAHCEFEPGPNGIDWPHIGAVMAPYWCITYSQVVYLLIIIRLQQAHVLQQSDDNLSLSIS